MPVERVAPSDLDDALVRIEREVGHVTKCLYDAATDEYVVITETRTETR